MLAHSPEDRPLEQIIDSYTMTTDLPCFLVDPQGFPILSPSVVQLPPLCQLILDTTRGAERCQLCFERAGRYSFNLGDAYIYACHAGLVEWAAPIVTAKGHVATLVAGGVSMWPMDEQAEEEITAVIEPLGLSLRDIRELIEEIPVISGRKVRALAHMLLATAGLIVYPGNKLMQKRRLVSEQQALLANSIQEKKLRISHSSSNYPLDKERELLGRVRLGDRRGAKEILNEILGDILFNSAGQPEVIKARIMELLIVLSRAAVEGGARLEELLTLDHKYMDELSHIEPLDELCAWIVGVLDNFMDIVYRSREGKSLPILQKAVDFLYNNYQRDVSLEEVAQAVHVSPYYLSHLFREELGVTYITFLTKLRIEEAKSLLLETDLTIQEISYLVGYRDSSYFTKVFKKLEGRTPTQFRR
ncbi:MAG: PocR ligand-binding domain-containing protein [Limnochordia bacterium]